MQPLWTDILHLIWKLPQSLQVRQLTKAAADREKAKYITISTNPWFIPVVVKSMGPIMDKVGHRIAGISKDPRSTLIDETNQEVWHSRCF